jgi:hypothetical protein
MKRFQYFTRVWLILIKAKNTSNKNENKHFIFNIHFSYTLYSIYIYIYMWPPLWSSGQSSWLQIRRPGFDSRHYQKKKVVGLEWGPLSLVSTTEELLDIKVTAPVYKTENTAVGIRHADHVAPSIAKVGNHFADKRRSLGDSDHGVVVYTYIYIYTYIYV